MMIRNGMGKGKRIRKWRRKMGLGFCKKEGDNKEAEEAVKTMEGKQK